MKPWFVGLAALAVLVGLSLWGWHRAVAPAQSSDSVPDRSVATLHRQTCGVCHVSGAGGAPRTGDAAAWQKRLEARGMDALVVNAREGFGGMAPRGLCRDCSDDEYRALIDYMANGAQGSAHSVRERD